MAATEPKWRRPPWLSWAQTAGWAVTDQGISAGTHFLLNILLARWLSPADYGAFAVAYSVFLLTASSHAALISEPMLVFGAGKYAPVFRRYLGILLCGHAGLAVGIAVLLAIAAVVLKAGGTAAVSQAILALAVASPFLLLFWLLRRAFYVGLKPQWAAGGGAVYLAFVLAGTFGLRARGWLSPASALILMGLAGLGVSLGLLALLRPQLASAGPPPSIRNALTDSWAYGRWAVGVGVLIWLTNNAYYVVLSMTASLEEVATFRALFNLLTPFHHITLALASIILPVMSRQFSTAGIPGVRKLVKYYLSILAPLGLLYALAVGASADLLVEIAYGGKYSTYARYLWPGLALPILWPAVSVLGNSLRAVNLPKQVFWAYLLSSAVVVAVGFPLIAMFRVPGAFASWSTALVAGLAALAWANRKLAQTADSQTATS